MGSGFHRWEKGSQLKRTNSSPCASRRCRVSVSPAVWPRADKLLSIFGENHRVKAGVYRRAIPCGLASRGCDENGNIPHEFQWSRIATVGLAVRASLA